MTNNTIISPVEQIRERLLKQGVTPEAYAADKLTLAEIVSYQAFILPTRPDTERKAALTDGKNKLIPASVRKG